MYQILSLLRISILLFSFILFLYPTVAKQCNPNDKEVLLDIKNQLNSSSSLPSWDPQTDCCMNWGNDIICDKEGRVTFLNLLAPEDVSVPVPPSIGDLTFLEILSILSYNFSGPFPRALCKLAHLKDLSIRATNLTGRIPNCLSQLKNLTSLDISQNPRITGPIPKGLAQLKSLVYLMLPMNNLTGHVPNFLSRMRSLEWIHLESNSLSGSIPTSLGFLPNLTFVVLSRNRLTGRIPKSFGMFKRRISIELNGNQLTGPIPRQMDRANVWYIDVSNNNLTGDALMLFGRNKRSAKTMDLSNNRFRFNFSKVDLPLKLKDLNMSHNMIYGSLPQQLGQLRLRSIDVSYNQLCGKIPVSERLKQFSPYYFAHNKCLCGSPLPACK